MPSSPQPNVEAHPDVTIEAIPAVLDASTIARLLGVSRPTSYEIIARCQPIRIGRLVRCLGQDFKAYLERQRVGE